ncbi:MAG: IclR family transcriptional regulator domain-containing protein [Betaproteobacteria bacterium]
MKRVEALARGLRVLNAVERAAGASLHQLHRETGLPKATLLRSLRTLEDAGLVARRLADGAYLPGRPAAAGRRVSSRWLPLIEAAGPSLEALGRTIPWPTDLGVRDGAAMLVLESNRRLSPIQVNRKALGVRPHMLWSAMGRAYLAYCPEAEREEVLSTLRASSAPEDRMARNRPRVEKLLAQTRAQGYGMRDARYGVLDLGARRQVSAIAVPVREGDVVIGCVNCVWLIDALSERQVVERHLDALLDAAHEIARRAAR